MSINFDRLLSDHCGGRYGFLSDLRCDAIKEGLYDGLYVATTNAGDLTQIQPGAMADIGPQGMAGYGTAFDRDTAIQRAVGEAVERYACVMFPPSAQMLRKSWHALDKAALHPSRFPQIAPEERARWPQGIGLRSVDEASTIDWVEGWSVTRGTPIFVPLDMAFIGRETPITEQVAPPISTGFAAGPDAEFAFQSGLQEVLERDAVALWWWAKRRVPHLDPKLYACETSQSFIAEGEALGTRTLLLDLTTDTGVPVVGALQLSESWPHVVFMSACRTTREAAILRAIEEIGSVRQALAHAERGLDRAALLAGTPAEPIDFALFHAANDNFDAFDFCLEPSAEAPSSPVGNLMETVARLKRLGHEAILVDCTLPDTAALGFTVVRAIVPGLMGISFCHALRFLGEPRFRRFAGLSETDNPLEACHDAPIPFA